MHDENVPRTARTTTPFLFVYGTLMQTERGSMGQMQRARLSAQGHFIGPAHTHGWLYDLGNYPGLKQHNNATNDDAFIANQPRDSGRRGNDVYGQVIQLFNPTLTFRWLDNYEGITNKTQTAYDQYQRTVTQVTLTSRRTLQAWVYLYLEHAPRVRRIASGNWSTRKKNLPR